MFGHVQSKFYLVWMLLVVNIVTSCPIGTDCGGSAPVVDLYRQPRRLALPTHWELRYCTIASSKTRKCHFECHMHCMHSHVQLQCGTMKTSEFMTTQMKLADPTLSEMSTDLDITSVTQFHLCPTATIYTGTYILADIQQPRARYTQVRS